MVWGAGRAKENLLPVVDGTVGVQGIRVPLWPPAGRGVGFVTIVTMAGEEVDVIEAGSNRVVATGFRIVRLSDVDLNEVPMGADGAIGCVGNEE